MNIYKKILPFTILLISVSSILSWCSLPIGNTAVWWFIQAIILFCFWKLKPKAYKVWQINLFLVALICEAVYGAFFMAENYWDWKMLISNLMVFSLPLASYTFARSSVLSSVLRFWLKYAWILFIILFPFLGSDAIGRYLIPYSFLLLFFPILSFKYKWITLVVFAIVFIYGIDSRSDVIKFTICLLLGLSIYTKAIIQRFNIYKIASIVLFVAPVVFFVLGAIGVFNIFRIEEELGLEGKYTMSTSSGDDMSVLVDTRTFLYIEQVNSAIDNNYILWGRSIARGCDSNHFGHMYDDMKKDVDSSFVGRGERDSSEVSIHNIFNYFGLIGVVIYFLIFLGASWNALYNSNSIYMQFVGVYVAFRWLFAWIEDFSKFDLNYLFLWIMIGMCYSPVFRQMTNMDVKIWINSIIKNNYLQHKFNL